MPGFVFSVEGKLLHVSFNILKFWSPKDKTFPLLLFFSFLFFLLTTDLDARTGEYKYCELCDKRKCFCTNLQGNVLCMRQIRTIMYARM